VRDRDFAESVRDCLGAVLDKPLPVRIDPKGFYTLRLSSRLIFDYLSSLDSISQTADQFPRDFIRGFADAEGSPAISVSGSQTPMLGFYIILVNTDLEILTYVRSLLWRRLGIRSLIILGKRHCGSMWSKLPCYYLKVGRREDQRRYASLVGFGMRRKQLKMMVALSLLDRLGPSKGAVQWQKLFEKRGRIWVRRVLGENDGAPDEI